MNRKRIVIIAIFALLVVALISVLFVLQKNDDTTSTSQQQAPSTSSEVDEQSTDQQEQVASAPPATQEKPPSQSTPPPQSSSQPPASKWPVQISAAEASSVTIVVNKKHQLPSSYVPSPLVSIGGYQMRSDAKGAADSLLAAASNAGYPLKVISAYRSYEYQKNLYNNYVKRDGQAAADTYSARPGFSEHQLGLVADVGNGSCDLETCFGKEHGD